MPLEENRRSPRPKVELSDDLYIELVDALLVEKRGLILTIAMTLFAGVAVGLATGDFVLWGFAGLMAVLGAFRLRVMSIHGRNRPSPSVSAARSKRVSSMNSSPKPGCSP